MCILVAAKTAGYFLGLPSYLVVLVHVVTIRKKAAKATAINYSHTLTIFHCFLILEALIMPMS